MQKKSNIISKLVLSTATAVMMAGFVGQHDKASAEDVKAIEFKPEYDGVCIDDKNVEYTVTKESKGTADGEIGEVTLSDGSNLKASTFVVPENLKDADTATKIHNVTAIGTEAFKDCTKLESVDIPASVDTIDKNAFDGCSNLKVLHIAGDNEHLDDMKLDPKFLGSATLESVYVDVENLTPDAKAALTKGISAGIIRENIKDLTVGTVENVVSSITDGEVKVDWATTANDGAIDTYMILRKDHETGKIEAIGLVKNEFGVDTEFVDSTAEFGKSYTYSVTPYLRDKYFANHTAGELYTASKYDSWGVVPGSPVENTDDLTVNEKLINGIMHYYSDEGELFTPVQNKNLTCVQGNNSKSWYVLDNRQNVYEKIDMATGTVDVNGNYIPDNGIGFVVREWDIKEKDEANWDNLKLDAVSKEDLATKEYRVFSLNVKDANGDVPTPSLKSADDTTKPESYAVYLELSKNMDPNSVRVVIPNDNGGLDYIYGDNEGEIEIVKSLPASNAPKSEYGFVKIMMDSAFPESEQPFILYADKLENSSSDETKSEDKKEESSKDANKTTGSSTGSKGYATGDVAGFGMLHAACSMLAAAGSTILGLFRKKK